METNRDEELLKNSHERAEYEAGVQWAIDTLRGKDAKFQDSFKRLPVTIWANYLEAKHKESQAL